MGLFSKVFKGVKKLAGGITGGDLLGVGASFLGSRMQNSASARASQRANEFTVEMMQNRHQWEVEDLKKAGLNPILSAGGTPSMGGSAVADVVNPLENAVNSALAIKMQEAQIDKLRSDISLNRSLEGSAHADALSKAASARVSNNIADTSSAIAAAGRTLGKVATYGVDNTIPKIKSIGSSARGAARAYFKQPVKNFKHLNPLHHWPSTSR